MHTRGWSGSEWHWHTGGVHFFNWLQSERGNAKLEPHKAGLQEDWIAPILQAYCHGQNLPHPHCGHCHLGPGHKLGVLGTGSSGNGCAEREHQEPRHGQMHRECWVPSGSHTHCLGDSSSSWDHPCECKGHGQTTKGHEGGLLIQQQLDLSLQEWQGHLSGLQPLQNLQVAPLAKKFTLQASLSISSLPTNQWVREFSSSLLTLHSVLSIP